MYTINIDVEFNKPLGRGVWTAHLIFNLPVMPLVGDKIRIMEEDLEEPPHWIQIKKIDSFDEAEQKEYEQNVWKNIRSDGLTVKERTIDHNYGIELVCQIWG